MPLLLYMAVSCDLNKRELEWSDIAIILSMFSCIYLGFLLVVGFSYWWNVAFLTLSFVFVVAIAQLVHMAQHQLQGQIEIAFHPNLELNSSTDRKLKKSIAGDKLMALRMQYSALQYALKKKNLALVCFVGMPLFPAIYILSFSRMVTMEFAYVLTMFAGMSVKCIMVTLLASDQIALSHEVGYSDAELLLQNRLEVAQKAFAFANNKHYKRNFINTEFKYEDENSPLKI